MRAVAHFVYTKLLAIRLVSRTTFFLGSGQGKRSMKRVVASLSLECGILYFVVVLLTEQYFYVPFNLKVILVLSKR